MITNLQILEEERKTITDTIRGAEDNAAMLAAQIQRMKVVLEALESKIEEEKSLMEPELPFGEAEDNVVPFEVVPDEAVTPVG